MEGAPVVASRIGGIQDQIVDALGQRRAQLANERDTLRQQHADLAQRNQLRRRLAGFAEQVIASLDDLDFDARQRLLRTVIEKVTVSGCRVEIHLTIPLSSVDAVATGGVGLPFRGQAPTGRGGRRRPLGRRVRHQKFTSR